MLTQTVSLHSHSCCKLIALKKEWGSLGLKKQVNLCMCSSPDFYVYISRASAERSVILVFFVSGSTPTNVKYVHRRAVNEISCCHRLWAQLSSTCLATGFWCDFFYFVKSMPLNGSWHLEILCLSYWAPYDQHHMLTDENRSYCELKYIQFRVKLVQNIKCSFYTFSGR